MANGTLTQPSIFPGYNPTSGQFKLGGKPSGKAGARVKLTVSLNNAPQIVYGIRCTVSYQLPDAFFLENPGFKRDMRDGGVDYDFLVAYQLTQQNITQDATHVVTIQGERGLNYHPFPSPYLFQGGNNVQVTAERVSDYPTLVFGEPEQTFEITPTLYVTLVLNEFIGGRQPTPVRAAP